MSLKSGNWICRCDFQTVSPTCDVPPLAWEGHLSLELETTRWRHHLDSPNAELVLNRHFYPKRHILPTGSGNIDNNLVDYGASALLLRLRAQRPPICIVSSSLLKEFVLNKILGFLSDIEITVDRMMFPWHKAIPTKSRLSVAAQRIGSDDQRLHWYPSFRRSQQNYWTTNPYS